MSAPDGGLRTGRRGRFVGLFAVIAVLLAIVLLIVGDPGNVGGVPPGQRLPPFALPLASGTITGDANIATRAHQGSLGEVPACSVRKSGVLNICQLYEHAPVVLALFVDGGSCPQVLSQLQRVAPSFPGVQFAAVAIEGDPSDFNALRRRLRALMRAHALSLPVGIDTDGVLAATYKVVSCPQLDFAYPGGVVQSKALLVAPSQATLRARVAALVAAARAHGWRQP